jgi:isoamylase
MSRIKPGRPYPLGATWDGKGVNFALFSGQATKVELCLFDSPDAATEQERIVLPERTDLVWHVYVEGLGPGQLYGYRVYGPYEPANGQRFNPNKLLVDPYAKAIANHTRWDDSMFPYTIGSPEEDFSLDKRDSAPCAPRGVVIDPRFDWGDDRRLDIPLYNSVIYEVHVKGFTMLHPEVPEELRGTYAGMAHPAVVDYLKDLGVTAIELLPVHQKVHDRHLLEKGLSNYWGYNTLGYFAPELDYCVDGQHGRQVIEFKEMVKAYHAAGLEVLLDVVYNHTAEGNHLGPMLSFKGVDNLAYYMTVPDERRFYMDFTGTGNSLNMDNPRTLQLIMDSLRYWVTEMHVDGFRFDLAATLARQLFEVNQLSSFFTIIHQDPILSQVKLIAEPWDVGPGGYMVGQFPVMWAEWNGKYRDTVRRFWKGDDSQVAELAYRLSGSSDLYQSSGRAPYASINFITAHDGFTLRDLVSYNEKHNEANGEGNNDGANDNESWNCGVEGPTDDPEINALRLKQMRNLMATLLLSQGAPMLLAGDEFGRSKRGNNNTYCQDNELSWLPWEWDTDAQELHEFTRRLIAIRHAHPILHRRSFFQGRDIHGQAVRDIIWYRPDGAEMDSEHLNEWNEDGELMRDDSFLLLLNAHYEPLPFTLPGEGDGRTWEVLVDTARPEGELPAGTAGEAYDLRERSLVLLRRRLAES